MDDTICEYKAGFISAGIKNPEIKYPQSVDGFYIGLKPIIGAIEGIKFLEQHFEVYITTRPSFMNPNCYLEKRLWVEKYLGLETCKNLTYAPNKNLLHGNYLIDDMEWIGFGGKQLLFGSDEYPNWYAIINYFKNNVLCLD